MPTGVVMLAYIEDYIKDELLISLGVEMMKHFELSEEDFYWGSPLVYLPREDYDLAHMEGKPGFLLDVNLYRSYYGIGYERGYLPLFIQIAEWLEQKLPGCRVLYGHDVNGEGFPFDAAVRVKLLNYYNKVGSQPYMLENEEQAQCLRKLYDE